MSMKVTVEEIWLGPHTVPPGRYLGHFPHRTAEKRIYHPCELTTKAKNGVWITRLGRVPLYVCSAARAEQLGTRWFPPLPALPEAFWTTNEFLFPCYVEE